MTAPETLNELAARVEAATGPDRELDALIHVQAKYAWPNIRLTDDSAPTYTASLDAAMLLVPEGYDWILQHTNGGITICAEVGGTDPEHRCFADTPALALTAACIRSLAVLGRKDG